MEQVEYFDLIDNSSNYSFVIINYTRFCPHKKLRSDFPFDPKQIGIKRQHNFQMLPALYLGGNSA